MARHAALLGHYDPGHHGQPILQYLFAQTRILHPRSSHPWLLCLFDTHGLCVFLAKIGLFCANRADDRQMSPRKATSTEVWTQFNNGGGWSTQALSVFIGLIGSVFANNGRQNLSPKTGRRITTDTDPARYRLRRACKLPSLTRLRSLHDVLTEVCLSPADGGRDTRCQFRCSLVRGRYIGPKWYPRPWHTPGNALRYCRYRCSTPKSDG